jgi:hypothetical protein
MLPESAGGSHVKIAETLQKTARRFRAIASRAKNA